MVPGYAGRVDGRTLLFIAAGFVLVVAVLVTALTVSSRFGGTIDLAGEQPRRPWWGSPVVWVLVGSAFAVVGLFVFPKLFGFAVLFLPFVWIGRFGSRRRSTREPDRPRADDDPSSAT